MPPCCARRSTAPRSCAMRPGATARCFACARRSSAGWAATSSPPPCAEAPAEGGRRRVTRTHSRELFLPPPQPSPARGEGVHRACGNAAETTAPIKLLIAALGGEGGGVLTDWIVSAAAEAGFPVQIDLDPRRRAAHRRHHLLHRDFSGARARARRQAPGAGAHARRRRHRHRGGERIAGSRPHGGVRLRHARAHARHRLAQPLLCHGREDRHGRRPLRPRQAHQDHRGQRARRRAHRHGCARQAKRLDHQRGDARRHRRVRTAAADRRAIGSGDPRRRQIGRQQPARLPRRARRPRAPKAQPAKPAENKKNAADHARELLEHEVTYSLPALAQADRDRRRAPADRLSERSAMRSSISTGCAPWSMPTRPAGAPGKLLKEVARHLAVRMSYEDVVRVAQAKIAPDAHAPHRARGTARHRTSRSRCTISSSPASRNSASCCRRCWRGRCCGSAERRGWLGRVYFGMEINSTSISGYLRFLMLAKLRALPPARLSLRAGTGADRSPGSA